MQYWSPRARGLYGRMWVDNPIGYCKLHLKYIAAQDIRTKHCGERRCRHLRIINHAWFAAREAERKSEARAADEAAARETNRAAQRARARAEAAEKERIRIGVLTGVWGKKEL